jgi:hypothetical protein
MTLRELIDSLAALDVPADTEVTFDCAITYLPVNSVQAVTVWGLDKRVMLSPEEAV